MNDTIHELADVIDSLHATPEYLSVGVPMVRVVDINNNFLKLDNCFLVDQETCDRHNKNHIPQKGDVIITRVGSYGMLAYVDIDSRFCLGQNIAIISPYEAEDGKFLYYYLKSPYIQNIIYGNSGGSSYKCIGLEQIKKLPLMIEGIEYRRIGDLLYQIDCKIENNRKINEELDRAARTIYDYWFLQFDFPDENGKPYKSSGGKMVWNEMLKREIPEGWSVSKVNDILANVPKTKKYKTNEYKLGSKYPIIDQSTEYICGYTDNENDLLDYEDCIVFGDHTKCVKYINFSFARGADGTQIIISANENISNYLLYRQILDMDLLSQGYSRYFKFLKDKFVIIPRKKVTEEYMKHMQKSLDKMRQVIIENRELESLRDFLLPLLMNGQVGFKEC